MKINVYNNSKDMFFEFERNKYEFDETNNIMTPNTSWFLLKPSQIDPKMNRYKLIPGDIIRINLRIRDIKFSNSQKYKDNNNTSLNESNNSNYNLKEMKGMRTERIINTTSDNIKFNKNIKNIEKNINIDTSEKIISITKKKELKTNEIFSKIEKKNKICRICYIEEEDEKNPLVQPCICDGSMKFIHLSCLRQWIKTHSCEKLEGNNNCSIFLIKQVECELCKTKFPDILKHQNKLYHLIDFSNEYQSHLTLESLTLDKHQNKFIYVVSLEKNKKIKIGRGHDCEIILSDISVSRIHSYLIVENKNVYLTDNDSKFATLVFIQASKLKLSLELPLYVQIGRTSIEIKIKKNFKLFSCCDIEEKTSIYYYYNQNEKYIKDNVGLIIKDDESCNEDGDYYYKNNKTQEIYENNRYKNDSINIKERDKMSDNEYFLIKHNKKNKDIKKNIFYEETLIKDDNLNNSESNNETKNKENGEEEKEKSDTNEEIKENESNEENFNRNENDNNDDNNENLIDNNNEEENENHTINLTTESRINENDSTNGKIR